MLLDRETAHSTIQSRKRFTVSLKSLIVELEQAPKALWQVGGPECVGGLNVRRLMVHYLLDQVLVDLAQSAIEHLASLEHVEDPVCKDLLAMTDAIDVEGKLI